MKDIQMCIKTIIISIILLSVIFVSPGCLEDEEKTYKYKINISNYNETEDYILYLPFPSHSRDYNEDILNSLKNKYKSVDFDILNSNKGLCLKLTHNENITIEVEGNLEKFDYELSMYNYSIESGRESYWLYSDTNESIHLNLYYERYSSIGSTSRKIYRTEGYVNRGWQLQNAEIENEEG